jgi:hypothetical protein
MKTIKLMVPVTLTMLDRKNSDSDPDVCFPNLWIRTFPSCKHEKEKIVESWQALEILPMVVTDHHDQIVTAYCYSNQNTSSQFVLAANSVFSVVDGEDAEPVGYEYFEERYQEHIWLIVYCRKCSTIFQACGL